MDANAKLSLSDAEVATILPMLDACGIDTIDLKRGFAACPGEHRHTHETRPGHCLVYPNSGRPRLYCTHQSCRADIDAANARLSALIPQGNKPINLADRRRQDKEAKQEKRQQKLLKLRFKHALADIVREYPWPYAEVIAGSWPKDHPPTEHWRFLLMGLFCEEDIIWCGRDPQDSGLGHEWRFRSVEEWMRERSCPGPFTCPHPFKPGTSSRSDAQVREPGYLIVESDSLSKDESCAVFRWIEAKIGLRLRAVVDSASRSLHAWYEYPPSDLLADLKIILPMLGCDGKMFTLSQPCRLPGHINPKTGNMQTLAYFIE